MDGAGEHLVYVAGHDGGPVLYHRRLDDLEATALTGTTGAQSPVLSPNGEWVAFFAEGRLKKVSLTTRALLTVCDASPDPRGVCWSAKR